VTGVLVGATVLTKTTGLALVGVVAVGAAIAARDRREYFRFGAIAGAVTLALVAPWLAFNYAQYGGLTAAKQLDAITGSLQSDPPFNLHGLATRLRQAGHGFFDAQLLSIRMTREARLWFGALGLVSGIALIRLWRDRRRRETAVLAWLLSSWPIAFVTMAVFILHLSGGRSDIAGRHLYAALPAVAIALAYAVRRAVGPAAALAVIALVSAVSLTFEAFDGAVFVRLVYGEDARHGAVGVLRVWAVIGWAFAAAALSITRWGKRERGRSA
jgi:hypothetical protein